MYVIVVVPAETPVTNPEELIVATLGDDEIHGLVAAAVSEPVNCDLVPIHDDKVPVMVGEGLIIKELFAVVEPHSLVTFNE